MKNKIIGVLLVLLVLVNVALIISFCNIKSKNADLEKRVETLEKTTDVQTETIVNVQNDIEYIKHNNSKK